MAEKATKVEKYDHLCLQQSDHVGLILVSPPLMEDNYSTWSRAMILALQAKNKIWFIDGMLPSPSSKSSKYSQWRQCNVMDLCLMKMIEMGTERDDLYHFTNTKNACCQVATLASTSQLWHRHFGHLSNKNLSFLSNKFPEICSSNSDSCLICPLAKQTRAPFGHLLALLLCVKSFVSSKCELVK
ncbi:uncharacterized protein LOC131159507 [Malania oleifera]|uniref:uncharacterized protein LOC131159507 n=1 Tax=Malania oleifera TaxID=397392 RepID=UPI0025AE76FA|nr:uncharacterized protein LOC131159507 [Malania oleifera]